jgi:quinol monooxygenase YgiN
MMNTEHSTQTTPAHPNKLWISAGLKVTAGNNPNHVKAALLILQKETVKEQGCHHFHLLQHKDSPSQFTLWEEWINEDALKQHFQAEHTKAYLAQSLTDVSYIEKLVKLT